MPNPDGALTSFGSSSKKKEDGSHFVLLVFYHVDPSDVRNQRESFSIEGLKWTEVDVNRWKDNDEIKRVQDLEPEIVEAIGNSRASIVVLLENYAKSRWCLDELWFISRISESFSKEGLKWTEVDVNRWKSALTEIVNLTRMVVFGCHAFGSKPPLEGFSNLIVELAQYCGGNPLTLKVLGSSLFVGDEDPRERTSIIEIWRSRLNSLSSLKETLIAKSKVYYKRALTPCHLLVKEICFYILLFSLSAKMRIMWLRYWSKIGTQKLGS
ncbi:hypothetical protein L1987_54217 [Smallanthus sonchifolius]|uniref:Uncharacterized protein n=1 Tax=Smallanthus sonchifolius TaxID=185202 RepID=A0ACB9E613_9ASTR|nr:hypothetical protein L1987_54217 [Smallanthus sonchifolius]